MNEAKAKSATLKQKAIHEGQEFLGISLYLAFFFCAVVTYSTVLLGKFNVSYFNYGSALMLHDAHLDILACRSLVVFCTFIPLFAFRELQRVLGADNFRSLFFRTGAMSKSNAD